MFAQRIKRGSLKRRIILFMAVTMNMFMASVVFADEQTQVAQQSVIGGLGGQFTDCSSPRPEICYEVFRPVCAERDTGVRCVTEPCPSTENTTYANDCKACADQSVMRFQVGSCEDLAVDLLIPKPSKQTAVMETAGK